MNAPSLGDRFGEEADEFEPLPVPENLLTGLMLSCLMLFLSLFVPYQLEGGSCLVSTSAGLFYRNAETRTLSGDFWKKVSREPVSAIMGIPYFALLLSIWLCFRLKNTPIIFSVPAGVNGVLLLMLGCMGGIFAIFITHLIPVLVAQPFVIFDFWFYFAPFFSGVIFFVIACAVQRIPERFLWSSLSLFGLIGTFYASAMHGANSLFWSFWVFPVHAVVGAGFALAALRVYRAQRKLEKAFRRALDQKHIR